MSLDSSDVSTASSSPMVVGTAAKRAVMKCLEDEAKLTPARVVRTPARNQNSDGSETPAGTTTALESFQKKTGAETGSALLLLTEAYLKKISRPKRKVLEEDVYVKEIENIIERDFFPYLDKLRAQENFAEAVEDDDVRKLQSLIAKYGRACFTESVDVQRLERMATPSTFDTPLSKAKNTQANAGGQSVRNPSPPRASSRINTDAENECKFLDSEKKESTNGLNSFMAKVTSEDNVSFEEICTLQSIAERIKHSWIFAAEAEANSALAIQNERNVNSDSHSLALKDSSIDVGKSKKSIPLDTWPYQARNMLMFNPDGVDAALQDKVDAAKKAKMEIVHENTRFAPGFLEQQEKAVKLSEHVANTKAMMKGIVGPDGKEIVPEAEAKLIAGFSIVGTPSPMPGIGADQSPAMFWGSIEDTPAPLSERVSSQRANTPIFKIPDIPERDKIGLQLAEKAAKNHRSKKTRALNEMQSKLAHSKSPSFGSVRSCNSSMSRISAMSPAAQLLLVKRLQKLPGSKSGSSPGSSIVDHALRNSYSPKSQRFSPSVSILGSEKSSKNITPSPLVKTPGKLVKPNTGEKNSKTKIAAPSSMTSSEVSLTDNLMELKNTNKRASAADFF